MGKLCKMNYGVSRSKLTLLTTVNWNCIIRSWFTKLSLVKLNNFEKLNTFEKLNNLPPPLNLQTHPCIRIQGLWSKIMILYCYWPFLQFHQCWCCPISTSFYCFIFRRQFLESLKWVWTQHAILQLCTLRMSLSLHSSSTVFTQWELKKGRDSGNFRSLVPTAQFNFTP